jgi:hypothetical protein
VRPRQVTWPKSSDSLTSLESTRTAPTRLHAFSNRREVLNSFINYILDVDWGDCVGRGGQVRPGRCL